jgi:para-nitrobenzyl esterase
MKSLIFLSMLCLAGAVSAAGTSDPLVSVTGGRIQGRILRSPDGAAFKGVPFAAPPVGDLRWREPRPVVGWQGVRDAGTMSASCVQQMSGWNNQEAQGNKEDCLYLNVWTSEWPSKTKKPVMMWIFGGGNTGGGASVDYLDGASLSRRGVVVVTINYRLGVFGFMAHPGLTAESSHKGSGNYALLDQLAALKWVHDNITKFGGDPDNVTVFGQSAGAGNTAYLLASPQSSGLFRRAIEESSAGGSSDVPTLQEAEQAGEHFAASLGSPAEATAAIKYLRSLPAEQVQNAAVAAKGSDRPTMGPSLDGWYMPISPRRAYVSGKAQALPLLIGSNSQEQTGPQPAALRKAVSDAFGINAQKALAYYGLTGAGDGNSDPLYGSASQQFWADSRQRCGGMQQAVWHAANSNIVYEYQFDRPIAGRPATQHSAEVPYVFGNLLPAGFLGGPFTESDRKVSDMLQIYWTNFARTGNPNGASLPNWPKFDPTARSYLEFTDAGPVAKAALRREICDLFMGNLQQQMKETGR